MRLPAVVAGETVVGVAVAVPEPFRQQLHDARVQLGDPEARNIVPHVTLVGPTAVADADLERLDAHLARTVARHRPFHVELRGTETFRPVSPVVFVGLAEGTGELTALERALRADVLDVPAQFPYHPHVTIAHDLGDAALDEAQKSMAEYAARFHVTHVDRFVHDGVRWQPVRRFALGADAAAGEPA